MTDTIQLIVNSTIDAINAMVKRQGAEDYYLGYCAATGKYRIFGDTDSHSESSRFAILHFEDDKLIVTLQDGVQREYEYCDPEFLLRVLEDLHPGSETILLKWD